MEPYANGTMGWTNQGTTFMIAIIGLVIVLLAILVAIGKFRSWYNSQIDAAHKSGFDEGYMLGGNDGYDTGYHDARHGGSLDDEDFVELEAIANGER